MRRSLSMLAAAAAAALALSACGGGNRDEDKIKAVVKDVGKNPSTLCDKYATADLLKQAGGKAACQTAAKDPKAADPDVKIDDVKVDGDKATATITSGAGTSKGQKSTIQFVKDGDNWKVSALS